MPDGSRKKILETAISDLWELEKRLRNDGHDTSKFQSELKRLMRNLSELNIEEQNGLDDTGSSN